MTLAWQRRAAHLLLHRAVHPAAQRLPDCSFVARAAGRLTLLLQVFEGPEEKPRVGRRAARKWLLVRETSTAERSSGRGVASLTAETMSHENVHKRDRIRPGG